MLKDTLGDPSAHPKWLGKSQLCFTRKLLVGIFNLWNISHLWMDDPFIMPFFSTKSLFFQRMNFGDQI